MSSEALLADMDSQSSELELDMSEVADVADADEAQKALAQAQAVFKGGSSLPRALKRNASVLSVASSMGEPTAASKASCLSTTAAEPAKEEKVPDTGHLNLYDTAYGGYHMRGALITENQRDSLTL